MTGNFWQILVVDSGELMWRWSTIVFGLLRRPPTARENEQQKSSNLNSKNGLRVLKKIYIFY
jgi:hypothetical protein